MPEGRIRNSGGSTVTLKPEYMITDHQGNVRVSFEDNGSGSAVLRQETSYYAWGMAMPNSTVATPTDPNKNLYNAGAELQDDWGGLPDYYQTFFRNYDAVLGRFVSVDPIAQATSDLSSFAYAGNNPVMLNDPMGDLFSSWSEVQQAIDNIQTHGRHGGHANSSTNFWTYASENDAFMAGASYVNMYGWNSGGSNFFSSYEQAAGFYNGITGSNVSTEAPSNYVNTVSWVRNSNGGNATLNGFSGYGTVENVGNLATATASKERIDWGGVANSSLGLLGGVGEVILGAATAEFGVGVYGIVDGVGRVGLNSVRLGAYLSRNKKFGDALPGNLGGLAGKILDGNEDFYDVGKYQNLLGIGNDAATMYLTGTTFSGAALSATGATLGAISDSYTIMYYYMQGVNFSPKK